MGVLTDVLDKLMFWRDDDPLDVDTDEMPAIDGCFTLPGAEIGTPSRRAASPGASDDEGCG